MSISFVNGYLCTSGCDESKARRGVDPHPSTNPDNVNGKDAAPGPTRAGEPAVVFGGSLQPASQIDRVNPVDGAQPGDPASLQSPQHAVDLLI
jgi:hypothetical protein